MNPTTLTRSHWLARLCLMLIAVIAVSGGVLQMTLGQPETNPRLDNIHRFLAGVYLGTGIISLWAAVTIRQQGMLVLLLALGILLSGLGRLISMAQVGLPEPAGLWITYLVVELVLPVVMTVAWAGMRRA
ncbi:DUF4345 family protein [Blastomonas sp.]|uniref:DUF4345 family protein n=1 Tax=Blastomonas sp. TaxID=1909299 RepID=UPI00359305AC